MPINKYLQQVKKLYANGISREHGYRGDLQTLLREMTNGIEVTNEPQNVTDCGNPDYVITKDEIPLGYIEAKDVGKDLNSKTYKEQFNRYKKALDNLIITDYLTFQLFDHGELVTEVKIAEIDGNKVKILPDNFEMFKTLIENFSSFLGQTIKSPQRLAEMMAGKAKLLEDILEKAVTSDEETQANSSLKGQFQTFKSMLIHDLTPKAFADIYAQTLAYGMFAARLHDKTLEDFSRQEAAELIPKTNPFLRKLFQYVAGYDIDDRIRTVVDNLADVFRATDIAELLKNFGKATQTTDPIIHFYETFLAAYDPKLRKSRGVYYTPEPVVKFIVRAVDDILKDEFGLSEGLADTSKTTVKKLVHGTATKKGKDVYENVEVHKVQILDPATGTGTFLAEVIKYIYGKKFKSMQGVWSSYVENDLIPRLNGFEILMASYSMAHLKLDLLLAETGYKPTREQRFNIYLTNSLEEAYPETGSLLSAWLGDEANAANEIKRDTPVMVVMGNPPYSVSSSNKGEWIQNLIADYKKDLNEKKINLDDDYIKFIRYGQHYIEKNGEGILAYISNNSFIDGITHRQMRKHLLETFDKIYILDLHGSAKKNEIALNGGVDENVFDIQQGVSIILCIKKSTLVNDKMSPVFHHDLYGDRKYKYSFLMDERLKSIIWKKLEYKKPYYFFVPKQFESEDDYVKYFSINNLFTISNSGVKTDRDKLFVDFSIENTSQKFKVLLSGNIPSTFIEEYRVVDSGSYKITKKIKDVSFDEDYIKPLLYRPFDLRYIYYDSKIVSRPARKVTSHILEGSLALLCCRQQSTFDFQHVLISKYLTEVCTVSLQTKETGYAFPLYLYPEDNLIEQARIPNLSQDIVNQIAEKLILTFHNEKESAPEDAFAPIDILDYIYAVLHSPSYREKYKEFLKIDFPRVPYPENKENFWQLVKLGGEIRTIHLLENPIVDNPITTYPEGGDNIVTRKMTTKSIGFELTDEDSRLGKVWINDEQYFDQVPEIAWNFYIGGYQPAQKWLKDRNGRELSYEDISHYQKIIVALTETDRIMKEIDEVIEV